MSKSRITAIEMENIKSYSDARIEFGEGITVISGENGAGKSTIFEAIGHCLFGVSSSKFIGKASNFLREGSKKGNINVYFIGDDGLEYMVTKPVGSGAVLHTRSESGDWFPLEDVNIKKEVAKRFRLSGNTGLDQMFMDIIGPFQSDFITPFFTTGVKRKDHFDKILGISQWKDLTDKTSFLKNRFEDKIERLNFEKNIMTKEVEELPLKEEKLKTDKKKKKELEASLKDLEKKIKEIEKEIAAMAALKFELDKKQKSETKLSEEIKGERRLQESKTQEMEKARESLDIVNQSKPGYEIYVTNEKIRKELGEKLEKKNQLTEKKAKIEKSTARLEQKIETNKIHALDDKEKNEKSLNETETNLKAAREKLEKAEKEFNEASSALDKIKGVKEKARSVDISIISRKADTINSHLSRLSTIENSITKRRERLKEKESLEVEASRLEEIEKNLSEVSDKISAGKNQVKHYKKGKKELQQGLCPYMGEKCKNLGDWNSDEYFDKKIEELQNEINKFESLKGQLEKEKQNALKSKSRLAALEQEENELKKELSETGRIADEIRNSIKPGELEDLIYQLSSSTTSLEDEKISGSITELEKVTGDFKFPGELQDFPASLGSLFRIFDEIHKQVLLQVGIFESKANESLKEKIQNKSSLETEKSKLEKDKKKFTGELKKINELFEKLKLEEKRLSTQKEEINKMDEELKAFENLTEEIKQVNEKLDNSREDYDRYNRHLKDSERVASLTKSIKALKESISLREEKMLKLRNEIASLSEKFQQEKLDKARGDFSNLKEKRGKDSQELQNIITGLESLVKEIEKMKEIKVKIREKKREISDYEKSRDFANFLRKNIISRIADEVGKDFRQEISGISNRIYRDISGRKTREELEWGDGYCIILRDQQNGNIRERVDRQLSGGQFMTAVIAIRLALLEAIGSGIAFFDEPTSNLDEEHRKNLADVFRRLDLRTEDRWFNQLFLVSHDESFEGITRHHIKVKMDPESGSVIDSPVSATIQNVRVSV